MLALVGVSSETWVIVFPASRPWAFLHRKPCSRADCAAIFEPYTVCDFQWNFYPESRANLTPHMPSVHISTRLQTSHHPVLLLRRQLLCAKSNSWQISECNHPTRLPFRPPTGFKWPNAILFYLVWHALWAMSLIACPFLVSQISFLSLSLFVFIATFPFNLISSNSCNIKRHLLRLHLCQPQKQLWDQAGWNGQRQLLWPPGVLFYDQAGIRSFVGFS